MIWEIGKVTAEDLGGLQRNLKNGKERVPSGWFVRFSTAKNEAQFVVPFEEIQDLYERHGEEIKEDIKRNLN